MKENKSVRRLVNWIRRRNNCRCCEGADCSEGGCPVATDKFCANLAWTKAGTPVVKPDRPTLNLVPSGEKACVKDLFLPLPLKKRLLTLGLTSGTEIAVISNESGRMIISVRDSRLGLSPDMACKITYQARG